MDNNKEAIYFVYIPADKVLIPCVDISKISMEKINKDFIQDWYNFIKNLQINYRKHENLDQTIDNLSKNFEIKTIENYFIILPKGFKGGFVKNYPDLFNASHEQIVNFIEKTNSMLDDIFIRTSEKIHIINMKIHPLTYLNLNIENSDWALTKARKKIIYISILVWQNYREKDKFICNIELIEKYCTPDIYNCDNYIMLFSRALNSKSNNLIDWCRNNKNKIIWDRDLLNDIPIYHRNICENELDFPDFKND